MTEDELQHRAENWLTQSGFLWHHCADTRRCRGPAGFPDLMAIYRGSATAKLLAAELKGSGRHRDEGQLNWGYSLLAAGIDYQLWTPREWQLGIVDSHLRSIM